MCCPVVLRSGWGLRRKHRRGKDYRASTSMGPRGGRGAAILGGRLPVSPTKKQVTGGGKGELLSQSLVRKSGEWAGREC